MKWLLGCDSNVQLLVIFHKVNSFTQSVLRWTSENYSRRATMAEGDEHLELKFRIFDGTDICHGSYLSSITIATLKQRLLSNWPQDKSVVPKSVGDLKLIHSGKFLENGKTLTESKIQFGHLPSEVITMHVVVQPAAAKRKTDKNQSEKQKQSSCSCTIL